MFPEAQMTWFVTRQNVAAILASASPHEWDEVASERGNVLERAGLFVLVCFSQTQSCSQLD